MSAHFGLAVAWLLISLEICSAGLYSGSRIYRLVVPGNATQDIYEGLSKFEAASLLDVLKMGRGVNDFTDVMVHRQGRRFLAHIIAKYGIASQVLQLDVEKSIKRSYRENRQAKSQRRKRSRSRKLDHNSYMSFSEMQRALEEIEHFNRRASLEEIGKSCENRSILLLKISTNTSLPIVWIDAGIHAREWIAPASAFYIIDKLLSRDGHPLLQKYQFYIAPNINPDGYQYSFYRRRYWRKNLGRNDENNCLGVDLNRNFPFKWGWSGASPNPCSEIFKGHASGDQAESKSIIAKLTQLASNIKLYLTLHSYGQYILTPFGYHQGIHPDNYDDLINLAQKVVHRVSKNHGKVYTAGSAADLLYAASGGSDDFASGGLNISYAYTIELPDYGGYNFLLPPKYIPEVGRQMWTALKVFVEYMK